MSAQLIGGLLSATGSIDLETGGRAALDEQLERLRRMEVESRAVVYGGMSRGVAPTVDSRRVSLDRQFAHNESRKVTLADTPMIDVGGWLGDYPEADGVEADLPRAMLEEFAEAVMSAQASVQCGAAYKERPKERESSTGSSASPCPAGSTLAWPAPGSASR